jgi:rubredoxin
MIAVVPCYRCGRVQTDPVRGASPWAVAVRERAQILVCPDCQAADAEWADSLDRCARCGGTRLKIVMDTIVCRQCGFDRPLDQEDG